MSIQPFRIDIPQADLDDLCTGPNSTAEVISPPWNSPRC